MGDFHVWGDEDFDWKSLGEAIDLMHCFMSKWGRIGVDSKEKYGTARLYINWFDGSLYSMVKPGYYYYRWPNWFHVIDYNVIRNISNCTGFTYIFRKYQEKIYSLAYKKAIKRWPSIEEEIVCCADYPELIDSDFCRNRYKG